jgi:hypothetical protein
MRKFMFSAATAMLLGCGLAASPASALPIGPSLTDAVPTNIVEARMTRKQMMMRKRMMRRGGMRRGRMMRRGASMSGAPNSENPSRPPRAQNQGQTTGGPRY